MKSKKMKSRGEGTDGESGSTLSSITGRNPSAHFTARSVYKDDFTVDKLKSQQEQPVV